MNSNILIKSTEKWVGKRKEKPDKHYINQMIKININSDKSHD